MHICTKKNLKRMQLSCIWFTILPTSFMIGCVIFTFTKMVGCLSGFLLDVEIRVGSISTDVVWMMFCTTEKPKHSAAQQLRLLPLKRLMYPRPPSKRSRFLATFFWPCVVLAFCTLDLLNSLQPTNWLVKWCPVVLACRLSWLPRYLFVCHVAPS